MGADNTILYITGSLAAMGVLAFCAYAGESVTYGRGQSTGLLYGR